MSRELLKDPSFTLLGSGSATSSFYVERSVWSIGFRSSKLLDVVNLSVSSFFFVLSSATGMQGGNCLYVVVYLLLCRSLCR